MESKSQTSELTNKLVNFKMHHLDSETAILLHTTYAHAHSARYGMRALDEKCAIHLSYFYEFIYLSV
jgi:hypothetical protein